MTTAERMLNVIEPQELDRHTRLVGWIAGGLVGTIIAAGAVVALLLAAHIG
jgi:hypothetical protein